MSSITEIPIAPSSVFLDLRSDPDEVPFGSYRHVLNMEVTGKKRRCRMSGWTRFDDQTPFNNQDLRDQLFSYPDKTGLSEQAINFIYEVRVGNYIKILAGTQNRLYARDNSNGNWRVISDMLGGEPAAWSEHVWTAGHYDQTVVLSNNLDKPVYHIVDQVAADNGQSVAVIPDLEKLNVTKVGQVLAWNNFVFFFNVEMDGVRMPNRLLWSDYKKPLSIIPGDGSLAGKTDLPSGEIILAARELKDVILIYTNFGIWELKVASSSAVFSTIRRYTSDKNRTGCLAYKRTLVSTGDTHYYMARNGVYKYDLYSSAPELVDWIHRATPAIYDDLDTSRCAVHVAGFHPGKQQMWISWAKNGEILPSTTLAIGLQFPFTSLIDAGFTAFVGAEPQVSMSVAQLLKQENICSGAEIAEWLGSAATGPDSCPQTPVGSSSPLQLPIYSTNTITLNDGTPAKLTVEDFYGDPTTPSIYTQLAGIRLVDICGPEFSGQDCNPHHSFIMASSQDLCLKQADDVYYREVCTDRADCGTYTRTGYVSILRSGAMCFNKPQVAKRLNGFYMEAHSEFSLAPANANFRAGVAAQAVDPNTASGQCLIFWQDEDPLPLKCLSEQTLEQSLEDGTAPDYTHAWPLFTVGNYIYYELMIDNPNGEPVNTGGAVCISRFGIDVGEN